MRPPFLPRNPRASGFAALEVVGEVKSSLFVGPTWTEFMQTSWSAQPLWYIDPVAGDDQARGDAAAPLRSWAELRERQVRGVQRSCTIHLLRDLPESDPLVFDWQIEPLGLVVVQGASTLVRSSTITARVVRAAATNTPNAITDFPLAAPGWTPDIVGVNGRFVQFTDGPAAGLSGWAVLDLGANQVRCSSWLDDAWTEAQPLAGNAYQVRRLLHVGRYWLAPLSGMVQVRTCRMGPSAAPAYPSGIDTASGGFVQFYTCELPELLCVGGHIGLLNCAVPEFGPFAEGTTIVADGGCILSSLGTPRIAQGAELQLDFGTVFQGTGIEVRHGATFNALDAGLFDSAGSAMRIYRNGFARLTAAFGSGAAGYGVLAEPIAQVQLGAGNFVTGALGDVKVGAVAVATWAAVAAAAFRVVDAASSTATSPL